MNPFHWKLEHQVALIIAMLVGAVLGTIIGYIAYAAGSGADGARPFLHWVWACPIYYGSCVYDAISNVWWTLAGAVIGIGIMYVRRLTAA